MFVAKTEKIVKLGKAQTGPGGRTGSCRSGVGRINWGSELTLNLGLAGQRADVNLSHGVVSALFPV